VGNDASCRGPIPIPHVYLEFPRAVFNATPNPGGTPFPKRQSVPPTNEDIAPAAALIPATRGDVGFDGRWQGKLPEGCNALRRLSLREECNAVEGWVGSTFAPLERK
jgi:hypothetical protein